MERRHLACYGAQASCLLFEYCKQYFALHMQRNKRITQRVRLTPKMRARRPRSIAGETPGVITGTALNGRLAHLTMFLRAAALAVVMGVPGLNA